MSAFDYSRSVATAKRLIARFGKDATLVGTTETGDPWRPVLTDVDATVKVAVMAYKKSEIDGTLVLSEDRKVYISTEGVSSAPAPGMKLEIDSTRYGIVQVMPMHPGPVIVYWEAQVRA